MILSLKLSWRPILSRSFVRFFYTAQNLSATLVICHSLSAENSYMELSQKFYEAMKACTSLKSPPIAQKLHAQLISTGFISSVFLQNHLINLYSNCGLIDDASRVFVDTEPRNVFTWNTMINALAYSGRIREAEKLFEQMPERDPVSWNLMMSGYFHNGQPEDTLKGFVSMVRSFIFFPEFSSFSSAMKACGSLGYVNLAHQLHGLVEKFDLSSDPSLQVSILDMYVKCGVVKLAERMFFRMQNPSLFCWNSMIYGYSKAYGVEKALDTFMRMPERDSVSWNTIISALSQHGFGAETLRMFMGMWNHGFRPNSMTYATILSACTSICDIEWGMHIHARVIRMELNIDDFVGNGLIDMYAKCGRIVSARKVFNNLGQCSVVAWTTLIGGLAQFGHEEEALVLFKQMRVVPIVLDEFTLATVLGVCSSQKRISYGKQLHAHAIKTGMDFSVSVGNALITMYAKCGDTCRANNAFELMPVTNVISWTAMISAFSQNGDVQRAQDYFYRMPERNVVTWNTMLRTYIQHRFWEEGLKLYGLMQRLGLKPDCVTFASSISACADLALLKLGTQLVAQANKLGLSSNVLVANSVVTMYSRCGEIKEAQKVFDTIHIKNQASWNAMMAGYAQNGQGKKVVEIFENMLEMGCAPDHISYVSVLSGCSHSGLVSEGKYYFSSMTKHYGILPTYEHFASMVDLLGRSGLLEQAKSMIDEMPFEPNSDIWVALLGASWMHCNTKLAEYAAKNLLDLDAEDSRSYVLLANTYSDSGKLERVMDVRKLIRQKGIKKNPGCSWIEVDNRVHVFTVDNTNHPEIKNIYKTLKEIVKKMEDIGSNASCATSVNSQNYHSEELAVALT